MSLSRVTGDPAAVARYARQMQDFSAELQSAALALRVSANTGMTISLAMDEARADLFVAADDTAKVRVRYVGTAEALLEYATVFDTVKSDSDAAAVQWQNAVDDDARWSRQLDRLADQLLSAPVDQQADIEHDIDVATRRLTDARHARYAAEARNDAAFRDWDTAAEICATRIFDSLEISQLNDGFWDEVAGSWKSFQEFAQEYLAPIWRVLRDICDVLAIVAGVLAAVCAIIPGLQPFAVVFGAVALGLAISSFLFTVALFAVGSEPLGEVYKGAIDLAIDAALSAVGGKAAKGLLDAPGAAYTKYGAGVIEYALGDSIPGLASDVGSLWDWEDDLVDKIPGADYMAYTGPPSLDGPLWTRPPDMEIPSLDPAMFTFDSFPQLQVDAITSSFESGELGLQGVASACR